MHEPARAAVECVWSDINKNTSLRSRLLLCFLDHRSNAKTDAERQIRSRDDPIIRSLPFARETATAIIDESGRALYCDSSKTIPDYAGEKTDAYRMRFVAWLETTLTNIDSIGALEKRWRASPKSAEIAFELRDMAVSLCRYELACEVYEALDTIEDPVVKQKEAAIEACIQRFQIMLEVDTIACIKRNEDIKVSDRTFQYVASHLERFIAAKKQDDAFEFAAYTTEAWAGWMCPSVEKSLALIEKLVAAFPAHQDVAFVCGCAGRLAIQNDSDDVASRGKKLLEKALAVEYEQAREEARERQADKPEEASKYVWLESLDDAIAAAKKEGKWVLVVREDG